MTRGESVIKKAAFLKAFAAVGIVKFAAQVARVDRRTVYKWLEGDPAFKSDYEQAERDAVNVLEQAAFKRAVAGVKSVRSFYDRNGNIINQETEVKYSDSLLQFLLTARDPKRFGKRVVDLHMLDLRKEAERIAADLGMPVEQVLREAGIEA
ncbi:MAG: hypothetical protein KGL39_22635 [Patescibacteria group bacterium]|nr:hypothetical protein [Patescibacteria group bacterium]